MLGIPLPRRQVVRPALNKQVFERTLRSMPTYLKTPTNKHIFVETLGEHKHATDPSHFIYRA